MPKRHELSLTAAKKEELMLGFKGMENSLQLAETLRYYRN